MLALSQLPLRMSVLYKYVSVQGHILSPPTLINCNIAGYQLPVGLNLCWLFLVHDLLSFSCKLSISNGIQRLVHFHRPHITHNFTQCSNLHDLRSIDSNNKATIKRPVGEGRPYLFPSDAIQPFIISGEDVYDSGSVFLFVDHVDDSGKVSYPNQQNFVHTNIPLLDLIPHIPVKMIQKIARIHHITIGSHVSKKNMISYFENHNCVSCSLFLSIFSITMSWTMKDCLRKLKTTKEPASVTIEQNTNQWPFPPPPLSSQLSHSFIKFLQ